jgi:hypothetical protein
MMLQCTNVQKQSALLLFIYTYMAVIDRQPLLPQLGHYPNSGPHHHRRLPTSKSSQSLTEPYCSCFCFLMPSTAAMSSSWDGYGGQIFPADMSSFHRHQDTLEAVFHHPPPETTTTTGLLRNDGSSPVVDDGGGHAAPRRRPFRTDRHSKIRTAQGVRDRRMRLSVGVAREFFALQDRLGFDKASKTVNWLLTQSKPAIDRLVDAAAAADDPAAVAASGGRRPTVVRGRGEGSSSSTCCCLTDSREAAEEATGNGRSRGGPDDGPPAALLEGHGGCGELGWIMSGAPTAAVATTTTTTPQQPDGHEYYYQYCLQLEEMMRCSNDEGETTPGDFLYGMQTRDRS